MAYQVVFKRYEFKYLLTREQKERLLSLMQPYMAPDRYGRSTIRNVYLDTDNYRLIRRSIEKPTYKEKIRVRSYAQANADSTVFVELKRKYKSLVYKRRLSLPEHEAMAWVQGKSAPPSSQIADEIAYFLSFYGDLTPKVFLSYEREAYRSRDDSKFRVTFDDTILSRESDLSLTADIGGSPLLPPDTVLMEIKCAGGIPLWMVRFLTEERLYKTSFSKYGTAYRTLIFPTLQGGISV